MSDNTPLLYITLPLLLLVFTLFVPTRAYAGNTGLYRNNKSSYWLYVLIPIVIHTVFWGLRYDVGKDWEQYRNIYMWCRNAGYVTNFELGYVKLNELLNSLGFSYVSIFILTSFINIFAIYFVANKYNRIFGAFLVLSFYLCSLVFSCQNAVRQMVSFSILIIAIELFAQAKVRKGAVIITVSAILAYLFHVSSVILVAVLLLLYLFKIVRVNKYVLIFVYFLAEIVGRAFQMQLYELTQAVGLWETLEYESLENSIYSAYMSEVEYNSGFGIYFRMMVMPVFILFQDIFYKEKKTASYYFYILFLIGIILRPILTGNYILGRMNIYFSGMSFYVYAYLSMYLIKNWKGAYLFNGKVSNSLVFFFIWTYNFITYIISFMTNQNGVYPYKMLDL